METLVIQKEISKNDFSKPKYGGKMIAKEELSKWKADDGFLYEWNEGILASKSPMRQEEAYITKKILRKFAGTVAYQEGGELLQEMDFWVSELQKRIPDIAFYTDMQIKAMARGTNEVPAFIVEIISEYDQINAVEMKLMEYFKVGVLVVWRVFPEMKMVVVYDSPKKATYYTDKELITAKPVINDLQITIEDLFQI